MTLGHSLRVEESGTAMTVKELAKRCKTVLESNYGSELKGLVMYGSVTRCPWALHRCRWAEANSNVGTSEEYR